MCNVMPTEVLGEGNIRYKLLHQIGYGNFAHIYSAVADKDTLKNTEQSAPNVTDTANELVACKVIKNKLVDDELIILRSLNHPNIVRYISTGVDNGDKKVIIMEYCAGGSLYEYWKKHKSAILEVHAKQLATFVIPPLEYLHQCGFVHCDFTMKNILLVCESQAVINCKLCDFGLSRSITCTTNTKICGTPNYVSPEMLDSGIVTPLSDIWALGVMIYALIYGKAPFETNNVKNTYKRIKKLKYYFPQTSIPISTQLIDLLTRIFRFESQRINLCGVKNHSWFSSGERVFPPLSLTEPRAMSQKKQRLNKIRLKLEERLNISEFASSSPRETPIIYVSDYHITEKFGIYCAFAGGGSCMTFNDTSCIASIPHTITDTEELADTEELTETMGPFKHQKSNRSFDNMPINQARPTSQTSPVSLTSPDSPVSPTTYPILTTKPPVEKVLYRNLEKTWHRLDSTQTNVTPEFKKRYELYKYYCGQKEWYNPLSNNPSSTTRNRICYVDKWYQKNGGIILFINAGITQIILPKPRANFTIDNDNNISLVKYVLVPIREYVFAPIGHQRFNLYDTLTTDQSKQLGMIYDYLCNLLL